MNNVFAAKLLQNLRNKKGNKGFTLIELLVVVIIIGVLAAVALPNLLGQVGKARESEAKNIIGALNRAQQAYYTERGAFANETLTTENLEVPTGGETYYTFSLEGEGIQFADGNDNANNGTRDYTGGVAFDTDDRIFSAVVCRAIDKDAGYDLDPAVAAELPTAGSGSGITAGCVGGTKDEVVR